MNKTLWLTFFGPPCSSHLCKRLSTFHHYYSLLLFLHTDHRHPVSTKTAVFIQRSTRSCCQTAYCWTSRLPCRRRSHMERPTGRRHLSTISDYLQKTTKTASVSTFISRPSLINLLFLCVVLVVAACYLGHS